MPGGQPSRGLAGLPGLLGPEGQSLRPDVSQKSFVGGWIAALAGSSTGSIFKTDGDVPVVLEKATAICPNIGGRVAKPFNEWTVLPHGELTQLDDRLLVVSGTLRMPPMGNVERRMTVVRLEDGRLVVYSAIALGEEHMKTIESFGNLAYLIIPNDLHRMDVKPWKDRYPAMTVVAPAGARAKVEQVVPVDVSSVSFSDPSVQFLTVAGTEEREAALSVETSTGTTLVLNDLIFNLANREGLTGWLFKAIGLTGDEPHIAAPVRWREIKDKRALRAQLESWAALPGLQRIIIAHGHMITDDPRGVLARIAEDLA